ncbi:mucin-13 isoform X3 [Corvus moneduloides]|uniref:mucin-13 isoform X3 n=1 Tax=Corvus moneduloides TaxID=1196302 RepID=UPI0013632CBD|nr:mucin-13 isoform X3 [Corvus moneduloides]
MRRSVFLAVWLSLVLSLLKETTATTSATTPVSATTNTAATGTTTANTPVSTTTNTAATGTTTANTPVSTTTNTAETTGTTSSTTPVSATTKPAVDFCREYPCGRNLATCISLQSSYTCECQYGFYYSDKNCYRGKVYPATIGVSASYSDSLQTVNSTEYEQLFNNVAAFFKTAFDNLTGYIQTVIVEIQPPKESRNSAPVNVTVTNLFTWNSTVNEASVNSAVQHAINSGGESYVRTYEDAVPCDVYQCDTQTTVCEGNMFPECKCKPGLEKTEWDDRSCSACSKNCTAEAHKYCVKEETVPVCRCMTNFKQEDGNCVACPVGYSGEDCRDNTELILIIVGTVFGAIILSLVIAVSIISVRAKGKRNPEKRSLIQPEYSNTNRSDDRPGMFPRVQTTSGHANPGYQSNNPYEMRSTNRGHFPERDYDDLYEISREPRGFRMQSRY